MAQQTGIEWTDMSSNPIRAVRKSDGKRGHACVHASPGCLHCYSERWNDWRGTGFKFNIPALQKVDIILDEKELTRMRRTKAGSKVFVCDMTDLFGHFVPDEYIVAVFAAMVENNQVTWQVLTKRPERMSSWVQHNLGAVPAHIWVGTSVENQEYADKRIQHLLRVPATVRFLSCEPLLSDIDFDICEDEGDAYGDGAVYWNMLSGYRWMRDGFEKEQQGTPPISWVIVGGESGPGARPMHPNWARSIRGQCRLAEIPFFFKQHGSWLHQSQLGAPVGGELHALPIGKKTHRWPDGTYSAEIGKKAAGRSLDGRTWDEFPCPTSTPMLQ